MDSFQKPILLVFCGCALCFILVAFGWFGMFRGVLGKDPDVAIAEESTVKISLPFQGIFFYEEAVVYAEDNGILRPRVSQGDLIAAGTSVADGYSAPFGGLVYYEIDGCEGLPFPNDLSSIDGAALWNRAKERNTEKTSLTAGAAMCHSGDALFKIIDNKKEIQCLIKFEEPLEISNLSVGESYELTLNDTSAKGVLTGVSYGEDGVYAALLMEPEDRWLDCRYIAGMLTVSAIRGVTVDNDAITEYNGENGVYLVEDGMIFFCPLDVLSKGKTETVVDGLAVGSAYLRSPDGVAEHEFLKDFR